MKTSIALALALIVPGAMIAGCASTTIAQDAEKADTTVLQTYALIGKNLDAYESTLTPGGPTYLNAEKVRTKAWYWVVYEHKLYTSGVIPDVTALITLAGEITGTSAPDASVVPAPPAS